MKIKYTALYYCIYCTYQELQLKPLHLENYYYENGFYTPKTIKEAKSYVFKGEAINNLYISLVTTEYPFYYIANKLHVNFKGKLEKLPLSPTTYNGFIDQNLDIIIKEINNFPKPLDIIKVGNKSFKVGNNFTLTITSVLKS